MLIVVTDEDNFAFKVVIAVLLFSINNRYGSADISSGVKPCLIKQIPSFCSSVSVVKLHSTAAF